MSQTKAQLIAGDTSQNVSVNDVTVASLNSGPLAGTRNRIINGGMAVDQRNAGAAQTITAGGVIYTVDRFLAVSTGASVTGQRIQGETAGQYRYRLTGAAGCTNIEFGQRIEQINSADLAGTTVTLSVDLANSLLTTVTWKALYATTADNFTTATSIASGTFTVNSTVTRYSTQISIPAAATTGLYVAFTVGAQTSGTWTIGNVQLEAGSVATPFERRSYGQELALCQRYYQGGGVAAWSANIIATHYFRVEMRAAPTLATNPSGGAYINGPVVDNKSFYGGYNVTAGFGWSATIEL